MQRLKVLQEQYKKGTSRSERLSFLSNLLLDNNKVILLISCVFCVCVY